MYAIIATGGKQYKVSEGDVLKVEKLNAAEGDSVGAQRSDVPQERKKRSERG